MGKLLFWIVLGVVAWFAWQAWRRAERAQQARTERAARPESALPEPMLQCTVCGVHLPASEALTDEGQPFCGVAHRDAWRARTR